METVSQHRFGKFSFDTASGELTADGAPVPLGSTASRILSVLIKRSGQLVTKDELMLRVWGRSAIGDNTLHVQITALRRTLGEGFIVTKQGRGYRFMDRTGGTEGTAAKAGNLTNYLSHSGRGLSLLIGRGHELRLLSELLAASPLVSLVGPGGVGKTTLALHAAREAATRFRDGVWVVELAPLNDPELIAGAVATVLGVKVGENVKSFETLARQLARRNLLLVLDNCEHVVAGCAQLAEAILKAAPDVKIIATSREVLSCAGEQVFTVPPLSLPPEDFRASASEQQAAAVELFIQRAKAANPHFDVTNDAISIAAKICRRVDGLPLAIEMVAGWVGTLGLEGIETKLAGSFEDALVSRRTAPVRHSTLRATLQWGHELLSPAEQVVLRRLAVFGGAFSMAAAEAVVAHSGIERSDAPFQIRRLINKSMIVVTPAPREHKYRLLETTRAFMLEKLAESDDLQPTRQRHAAYVLDTLRRAAVAWESSGDQAFLNQYAPVLGDLRRALEWALDYDPQTAVALAGSSWPLWRELPVRAEGRRWLTLARERLRDDTPPALEAHLRRGLGELHFNTAEVKSAHEEFAQAVELFRSVGDLPQLGSTLAALGYASLMLGVTEEDFRAAQASVEKGLDLIGRNKRPRALAAAWSAKFCVETRLKLPTMLDTGRRAIQLCEISGAERTGFVVSGNLVEALLEAGDVESAITRGQKLIARLRDTYQTDILGYVQGIVTAALTFRGDVHEALALANEAVPLLRDEGMLFWLFDHLALRCALAGQPRDAALVSGYANFLFREFGRPREPIGREALSRLSAVLGKALAESETEELDRLGAQLTEAQVLALALPTAIPPQIASAHRHNESSFGSTREHLVLQR